MAITAIDKSDIVKEYGRKPLDTGSPETQVALLTQRIIYLTEHVKQNRNDLHTRRGLVSLVGKRRRLLKYLKKNKITLQRYRDLISKLGLRDSF